MAILTAVLTHLEPPLVEAQLAYLRTLAPGARFVVCHGGRRSDFDGLPPGSGLFIEDPSLRGPHFAKSINDTVRAVYEGYVRDDPAIDLVYLIEYDHLILSADFEDPLRALARDSDAGLFAKGASRRNDSNWPYVLNIRDDRRLDGFISSVSRREDRATRWGCLGTGLLLRREALQAFCAMVDPPPYYVEMFLPTAIYHLGFDVVDIDAVGDLYSAIRWLPEFEIQEVLAAKRAGRTFAHPFKRLEELDVIGAAMGAGENSSSAPRSG